LIYTLQHFFQIPLGEGAGLGAVGVVMQIEQVRVELSVVVDEALFFYVGFVRAPAFRLDVEHRAEAQAVEAEEPAAERPVLHATATGFGQVLAQTALGVCALADIIDLTISRVFERVDPDGVASVSEVMSELIGVSLDVAGDHTILSSTLR